MIYKRLLDKLGARLHVVGEEVEALHMAFRHYKQWSLLDFALAQSQPVTAEDSVLLEHLTQKLENHYPVQYLMGETVFRDLRLRVDERVLIPRPETEELVERILKDHQEQALRVLDIGTGSGAIALALKAHRPSWTILAVDCLSSALEVARTNAQRHQLDVHFLLSDVFEQVTGEFDIVVSNPPYIDWEERHEVGKNVFLNEPHQALFAQEKGLAIYRRISQGLAHHLADNGCLYLEIGHRQGLDVTQLFQSAFPDKTLSLYTDSFHRDRMVVMTP